MTSDARTRKDLVDFPCHFEFKAFGPMDDTGDFFNQVHSAVANVVQVSTQAMRSRTSAGGKYQCVTILVSLRNREQLEGVYAALRGINDLKYLL